jgi:thermitase
MKRKIAGIGICMLMIVAVVIPAAGTMNEMATKKNKFFKNQASMEFVPGEFIVKLKKGTTFSSSSQLKALNEKNQVNVFEKVFLNAENTILDNIYLLYVPVGSDILSFVQEYMSCPDVVYAEPNWIVYPCGIPNDANFSNQWYFHNTGQVFLNWQGHNYSGLPDADIDAPEVWDIETGSSDVVIAILDSGIDCMHPDLAPNIWNNTNEIPNNGIDDDNNGYIDDVRGWNFYYNNNNVTDGHGHGTMCAGVAGAITDNGIWGAGVAGNCKIMPVRIANEEWDSSTSVVGPGLRYAADNGADVMSMSFGWYSYSSFLGDAVNYSYSKGVFMCAAAGNGNTSKKLWPAGYENVTAAAATTQNDTRVTPKDWPGGWGSSYGDWVDIAAPGNIIFSTTPTYHVYWNDYGLIPNFDWACGTSFASPMVAGVAALLLSKNPTLTQGEVKELLCENVDPYDSPEYIGTGRLNAQKALNALLPLPPDSPTITGPTKGTVGVATAYNFTTTDPNDKEVYYFIDWGDQTNSSWIGPYSSGDVINKSHTWSKRGSYNIKAKAKDIHGNESGWGTLQVTMPRSYSIPFDPFLQRLFERFPRLFPILRHLLGY